MTVGDIYNYINTFAPFDSQAEWDNSGLLIGSMSDKVENVCICLDVTEKTIDEAVKNAAQLIISHHPVIFHPISEISSQSIAYKLIKNNISVICAHTNLDIAPGGVNDTLCERLGLSKCASTECPYLILCKPKKIQASVYEFASECARLLNTEATLSESGNYNGLIAVCCGAGGSLINEAKNAGASILLTGEAKYHEIMDAAQLGLTVISLGHYETEFPVLSVLQEKLSSAFPELKLDTVKFERDIITVN